MKDFIKWLGLTVLLTVVLVGGTGAAVYTVKKISEYPRVYTANNVDRFIIERGNQYFNIGYSELKTNITHGATWTGTNANFTNIVASNVTVQVNVVNTNYSTNTFIDTLIATNATFGDVSATNVSFTTIYGDTNIFTNVTVVGGSTFDNATVTNGLTNTALANAPFIKADAGGRLTAQYSGASLTGVVSAAYVTTPTLTNQVYGSNVSGAVSLATAATTAGTATNAVNATNWIGLASSNAYNGSFVGDGSGLTNLTLTNAAVSNAQSSIYVTTPTLTNKVYGSNVVGAVGDATNSTYAGTATNLLNYTFPANTTAGVLTNNGSGTLSWVPIEQIITNTTFNTFTSTVVQVTELTVLSNATIRGGLTVNNVTVTNTLAFTTNAWAGPTNVIDAQKARVRYHSYTPCHISGITNKTTFTVGGVLLTLENISATNWNVTLDGGFSGGARTHVVTNGQTIKLSIEYDPSGPETNYVARSMGF